MELIYKKEAEKMIKYNKYLKNKKGFTLIEVILSIAILGIISIAFLSMFTSGIVGISNSGKKSESHYTAQSDIEIKINDFKKPPDKNPISLIFLDENSDIANNYKDRKSVV